MPAADTLNNLRAVLRFGAQKGARAPILRRTDAISGGIYDVKGLPSLPGLGTGAAGHVHLLATVSG